MDLPACCSVPGPGESDFQFYIQQKLNPSIPLLSQTLAKTMGRCNGFTCHLKFGDGRTNSAEWLHSFHISQTKNHIAVWLPTGHSHCHTRTHCYSPIRLYLISRFVRKTFVLLLNIQNYFLELKTEARMVVKIGVCTVNWQEENLQNFSAQSPVFAS